LKDSMQLISLVVIFFWGLWGFLYKYGVMKIGFSKAVLVTSTVYTFINIVVIAYLINRGVGFPVNSATGFLAIGTVFGVSASLLFILALRKYPGSIVIPLTALYPAVGALLSIAVLKEEIKAVNAVGILLAVIAGFFLTR